MNTLFTLFLNACLVQILSGEPETLTFTYADSQLWHAEHYLNLCLNRPPISPDSQLTDELINFRLTRIWSQQVRFIIVLTFKMRAKSSCRSPGGTRRNSACGGVIRMQTRCVNNSRRWITEWTFTSCIRQWIKTRNSGWNRISCTSYFNYN